MDNKTSKIGKAIKNNEINNNKSMQNNKIKLKNEKTQNGKIILNNEIIQNGNVILNNKSMQKNKNGVEFLKKQPIAHRGLHDKKCPENSIGAFENAIKFGFAIELDIHLTSDNKVVVFHDDDLMRACGVNKKIKKLSFEQLRKYNIFGSTFSIPSLEDVLKLVNGKVSLLIELKTDRRAGVLEKYAMQILSTYKGNFALQSFNPLSLMWLKRHFPKIPRGQLSRNFKSIKFSRILISKLSLAKICGIDFIAFDYKDLPNKYVEQHKDLPLFVYTILDEKSLTKIKKIIKIDNYIFENFIPKI